MHGHEEEIVTSIHFVKMKTKYLQTQASRTLSYIFSLSNNYSAINTSVLETVNLITQVISSIRRETD